jgi:hypothetical protein
VLCGIATAAAAAVPAFWTAMFSVSSFTGCFIECSSPDPLGGVMLAVVTVVLLGLPLLVGLVIGGANKEQAAGAIAVAVTVLGFAAVTLAALAAHG